MQATLHNTAFAADERELIDTLINNIIACYQDRTANDDSAGRRWYRYAQDFAADVALSTGVSLTVAAYVVAVTSNNVPWSRQLTNTAPLIRYLLAGGDPAEKSFGFVPVCAAKAARIVRGELAALTGPKVEVFAANILGDYSGVTVDRWAVRVALGRFTDEAETNKWVRAGSRKRALLEAAYHEAARLTREAPATLQAITWTVCRGSSGF